MSVCEASLVGQCLLCLLMHVFTFRKLTDTQQLPTRPWSITLSSVSQPRPPKVPYARSTHQNWHTVIFNRLYLGEGRLHKTGLSFHAWLFLGGVTHRNACTGWVFPIDRNTFEVCAAPPASMISGAIIKLLCLCDVIGKWSILVRLLID